jgi:hypothetical protein
MTTLSTVVFDLNMTLFSRRWSNLFSGQARIRAGYSYYLYINILSSISRPEIVLQRINLRRECKPPAVLASGVENVSNCGRSMTTLQANRPLQDMRRGTLAPARTAAAALGSNVYTAANHRLRGD